MTCRYVKMREHTVIHGEALKSAGVAVSEAAFVSPSICRGTLAEAEREEFPNAGDSQTAQV